MIETFFFKLSHQQQQQEIEELRAKLNDIGRQKEEYDNAMRNGTVPVAGSTTTAAGGSSSSSTISASSVMAAPLQPSASATSAPSNNNSNNSDSDSQTSSPSLTRSAVNSFSDGSGAPTKDSNGGGTKKPHSSLRGHIRAFLPNNQRTVVRYKYAFVFLIINRFR